MLSKHLLLLDSSLERRFAIWFALKFARGLCTLILCQNFKNKNVNYLLGQRLTHKESNKNHNRTPKVEKRITIQKSRQANYFETYSFHNFDTFG